jgi:hypothetical protein
VCLCLCLCLCVGWVELLCKAFNLFELLTLFKCDCPQMNQDDKKRQAQGTFLDDSAKELLDEAIIAMNDTSNQYIQSLERVQTLEQQLQQLAIKGQAQAVDDIATLRLFLSRLLSLLAR